MFLRLHPILIGQHIMTHLNQVISVCELNSWLYRWLTEADEASLPHNPYKVTRYWQPFVPRFKFCISFYIENNIVFQSYYYVFHTVGSKNLTRLERKGLAREGSWRGHCCCRWYERHCKILPSKGVKNGPAVSVGMTLPVVSKSTDYDIL